MSCVFCPVVLAGESAPTLDSFSKIVPKYLEPSDFQACYFRDLELQNSGKSCWCVTAQDTRDHTAYGTQYFLIYPKDVFTKPGEPLFKLSGQRVITIQENLLSGSYVITWGAGTGLDITVIGLVKNRFAQLFPEETHYGGYGTKEFPVLLKDPREAMQYSGKVREYPAMIAIFLWNARTNCMDDNNPQCPDTIIYRWDLKKLRYEPYKKVNWEYLFK